MSEEKGSSVKSSNSTNVTGCYELSEREDYKDPLYSMQFHLTSKGNQELVSEVPYYIVLSESQKIIEVGMTDEMGRTVRVFMDTPKEIEVVVGKKAMNYIRENNLCSSLNLRNE